PSKIRSLNHREKQCDGYPPRNLAAKVEKLIETAKYYLKKFSTQALSHIIPSLGTKCKKYHFSI
ncbi:MAG: hypothetical protein II838_13590, partial [Lachnospiraceae bacterium]|nr:hypothetical protein [Lachnospiraceae bacterium]